MDSKLLNVERSFDAKSPLGQLLVEHREQILAITREHRATNVQVFGSVARGEDTLGSDVDLLMEFLPPLSLLMRVGLFEDLESELGVSVDVSTPVGLRKRYRSVVLSESRGL